MNVMLVAFSQPIIKEGSEQSLYANPIYISERAACICYDSQPKKKGVIVKQCMRDGHYSILEHISFTFLVEGISRACLAQLSRHRHISMSVRSQRYCVEDDFDYVNPFKPGSEESKALDIDISVTKNLYSELLEKGVKAEDARSVLPNACCTNLYLTANARALIEIANLRLCTRAQKEIRELFNRIKIEITKVCPEVSNYMVPQCEKNSDLYFCTEHKSCGRHKTLHEITKNIDISDDLR